MQLTLKLTTENDAFEKDFQGEIMRILMRAAGQMEEEANCRPLFDANGNTVGQWEITD